MKSQGPTLTEQADIAEEFVSHVADIVGVSLSFERDEIHNEVLRIEAVGDGLGILIGRRAATAQAIDELVRTVLQRSGGSIREGRVGVERGGV